jgi:hypothetical protein
MQTIVQKSASSASVAFPDTTGRLAHDVGKYSKDIANQKSLSSFKLNKLLSPCTSKHLSLMHRQAYIKDSGWGLLHPEHII